MKYKAMTFRGSLKPIREPEIIYILPASADPDDYRVIYPNTLKKDLLSLLLLDRLRIKQFNGCSNEAADAVKQNLKIILNRKQEIGVIRLNQLFISGVVLFIAGIINWTFPDPIPIVDEVLLTFGGGALAYFGYSRRKKRLPVIREKSEQAAKKVEELDVIDDPLLTRIYKSIQSKEKPDLNKLNRLAMSKIDRFDLESEWLVKYINIRELIKSGDISPAEVRDTMTGLQDILPLKHIANLEIRKKTRQIRRVLKKAAQKSEISEGTIIVYCEFYKSARDYFDTPGEEI